MQNKPAIPALKVGSFHVPHNMKHGVELGCKEACRHGAIVGKLKQKVKVNVSHEIQVLVEWWARTLEQWPAYANAIVSLFILNLESLSIDKPKKKKKYFLLFLISASCCLYVKQEEKRKTTVKTHQYSEGHAEGWCDDASDRVTWRQVIRCANP